MLGCEVNEKRFSLTLLIIQSGKIFQAMNITYKKEAGLVI